VIDVVRDIAEYIPLKKGQQLTAAQLLEQFLFAREVHYRYAHTLSGGERKRLYLLTILMANPNFLILDEPTNDLDIATMTVLEDFLMEYEGCVLVVSHDRYFLDKVCQHIFAVRAGGVIKDFPGNYTDYRVWEAEQEKHPDPVVVPDEKPAEKPVEKTEKRKLSYKEKLEFEQLDKEIPLLEEKRRLMNERVSAGAVGGAEAELFFKELAALSESIEEKSLRWLELAELV
jgi:ATP-binding cassette subfamily F protein uup